jgi:hypothetical protein
MQEWWAVVVALTAEGNQLALRHLIAFGDPDFAQIRIGRRDASDVLNSHSKTVIRYPSGEAHGPSSRGPHDGSYWDAVVDAAMAGGEPMGGRFKSPGNFCGNWRNERFASRYGNVDRRAEQKD